jgi:hypothetical protein
VDRVEDGDILSTLAAQRSQIEDFGRLTAGDPARGEFRYAPGKWTVNELLGHCIDTERVFAYRALRVARGDGKALTGFDQDQWVAADGYASRVLPDLLDEWVGVRGETVRLFRNMPAHAWALTGSADGKPVSVRGLAWLTAGHADHHLAVLLERYL